MENRAWTIAVANLQNFRCNVGATASPEDTPLDSALVVADGSITLVQQDVQFKYTYT